MLLYLSRSRFIGCKSFSQLSSYKGRFHIYPARFNFLDPTTQICEGEGGFSGYLQNFLIHRETTTQIRANRLCEGL